MKARRALAAAATVALAALVNITTGMVTQHWAVAWWAATAVLVVIGAAVQVWLTVAEASGRRQSMRNVTATGSIVQQMHGEGEQTIDTARATDITQRTD